MGGPGGIKARETGDQDRDVKDAGDLLEDDERLGSSGLRSRSTSTS
jgi:hypothetical protein